MLMRYELAQHFQRYPVVENENLLVASVKAISQGACVKVL